MVQTRTDEQRDGFDGERWWSTPDKEPKGKIENSHHQNPEIKIPHSRGRSRVVHTKNQSTLDAARFTRSSLVHSSMKFVLFVWALFCSLLSTAYPFSWIRSCGLVISDTLVPFLHLITALSTLSVLLHSPFRAAQSL
jgi:hypothetical protein